MGRRWIGWVLSLSLLFLFISSPIFGDEKVSIKARNLRYYEDVNQLIASGDATLKFKDIEISAPVLILDTEKNQIRSEGRVLVSRKNEEMSSSYVFMDLENKILQADGLYMEMEISGTKDEKFYIKAQQFSDEDGVSKGRGAFISTCEYDKPHYYIWAETFIYHPGERIVAQNVVFYNSIFFIPTAFWSPTYVFELGKRKVVYLMPVIGDNKTEGNFYKHTFDYYFSPAKQGQAYIDFMSEIGLGLGVRHKYDATMGGKGVEGEAFYYSYVETSDYKSSWKQDTQLNDEWKVGFDVAESDAFLIGGGSAQKSSQRFTLGYDDLGDAHSFSYSRSLSKESATSETQNFGYSRKYNGKEEWGFKLARSRNSLSRDTYTLNQNHTLAYDYGLKNTFVYKRDETGSDTGVFNERLDTDTSIHKDFGWVDTTTVFDLYFDPDGNTVRTDRVSRFEKIPETTFKFNTLKWAGFNFNETVTVGDYEETRFYNGFESPVVIRSTRTKLAQSMNRTWSGLPGKGKFTYSSGYNQYLYSTGDQQYNINYNLGYSTDTMGFLKTNSRYNRSYLGDSLDTNENGGSPFVGDVLGDSNQNAYNETLTFYLFNPSKYFFKVDSGYDWNLEEQKDYQLNLTVKPNSMFHAKFTTKWLIDEHEYTILNGSLTIDPSGIHRFNVGYNYDINVGELRDASITTKTRIGNRWESRWDIEAKNTYDRRQREELLLQEISLVKDMHRRKMKFTWKRNLEEFRFTFTINAFPEDSIGYKRDNLTDFELEGVLDDSSVKRI